MMPGGSLVNGRFAAVCFEVLMQEVALSVNFEIELLPLLCDLRREGKRGVTWKKSSAAS